VTRGQFRQFVEATGYRTDAARDGKGIGQFNPSGAASGSRQFMDWRCVGNLYMTDDHPVIGVSWNDAVAFCEWLSKKEKKKYRLPTEAEWEYACRAGTTTRYWTGNDPESLVRGANVPDASFLEANDGNVSYAVLNGRDGFGGLATVREFAANPFGLYDMHGNVWEWCQDGWDPKFYEQKLRDDPLAPIDKPSHVIRGGCYL
jgi:sulfatase modifying factor 1